MSRASGDDVHHRALARWEPGQPDPNQDREAGKEVTGSDIAWVISVALTATIGMMGAIWIGEILWDRWMR